MANNFRIGENLARLARSGFALESCCASIVAYEALALLSSQLCRHLRQHLGTSLTTAPVHLLAVHVVAQLVHAQTVTNTRKSKTVERQQGHE